MLPILLLWEKEHYPKELQARYCGTLELANGWIKNTFIQYLKQIE
ncbi:MAG: hypothetical protein EZS26_003332 [Candidatus Ordinivivax streblomastigis]|uniref:Uncharacterized protein n=1 Tax=Candidatus Ordinivivax streblomastigis TaxID=2540710 RepID=A0A5M8NVW8_9BACT|nr:MAG: hypothetical protein EZS26_003332 [Candidatus Ordinivivax streblomastigis]